MSDQQRRSQRRPYQKPVLERVRLTAEEAVLANCKGAGPGKNDFNCRPGTGSCKFTFGS